MTATRRLATLIALTVSVILVGTLPASAGYADTVSTSAQLSTLTVAAPTNLSVTDYCRLTTTTTERTVDPTTNSTSTRITSYTTGTTTVHHDDRTTVSGNTTTTVSRRTTLYASLNWTASTSPGVSGYRVNVRTGDHMVPMGTVTGTAISGSEDARYTAYGLSLSVTTLTSYGWTAESVATRPLTCA
jgi:hypothetical protein